MLAAQADGYVTAEMDTIGMVHGDTHREFTGRTTLLDDDLVPYSEAEQRQRAAWQTCPEFLDWLGAEPAELARLVEETPGLAALDDPWTVPGLALIEQAAFTAFPQVTKSATSEQMALLDRMARGIGHIFLQAFGEGKWVWVQTLYENPPGPALEIPKSPEWINPGSLLRGALRQRNGGVLADLLRRNIEAHREWLASDFNQS
ncbi:hypothetical protein ACFWVM_29115 [Nocardia fluminea]|uniref:hypothetical protein n=1 Tax=Nocardia fluminea TaxID=134984 RepID=UPI0036677746